MIKRPNTNAQRQKRHKRVRAKVFGTTQRPRLNVFRSEKNIYEHKERKTEPSAQSRKSGESLAHRRASRFCLGPYKYRAMSAI